MLIPIEEMEAMLDEIAAEFPQDIYKELNGGIMLLPQAKPDSKGKKNDLYTLGEYHSGGDMGRYIIIYYGSFSQVYGHLGRESLKKELIDTLKHELTHHLESLAGERDLEIQDAQDMADYMSQKDRRRLTDEDRPLVK